MILDYPSGPNISQGSLYNKEERERKKGREGREIGRCCALKWKKRPGAKKHGELSKAKKGKETDFSLEPPEGRSLADNLILVQQDLFYTSALQNCKIINLYCFNP